MLSKQCPFCLEYSYSSCPGKVWICPKCGKDITKADFVNPITKAKIVGKP